MKLTWPTNREQRSDEADITRNYTTASAWSEGDKQSLDHLVPLVYDELRQLAAGQVVAAAET